MLDVTKIEVRDRADENRKDVRLLYARITCTEMVPYPVPALKEDGEISADQAKRRAVISLWRHFYADLLPALHELRDDAVKFLDSAKSMEVDEKFKALFARLSDPSPEQIDTLPIKRLEHPVAK
jgi:hypothetical protein